MVADTLLPGSGGVPVRALSLSVRDQGAGIPEPELESIFERFVQSTRSETRAGGTGLGLSTCREIVHLHRGTSQARKRPDGGAEVLLQMPRALTREGAHQHPPPRLEVPQ